MKKIFIAMGLLALMAAGCGKTMSTTETTQRMEGALPNPVQTDVQVKSMDDVSSIIKETTVTEQKASAITDDVNVLDADAADLNDMTEVSNEY